MSEGIRSGVNWMRLNDDVEDLRDRADHERLGQTGHADQQAMAAGEDRGQDLLDHVGLADDHAAELLDHLVRLWLNWDRTSLMSFDTGGSFLGRSGAGLL